MTEITLKGDTINTIGTLPQIGSIAPDFTVTKTDLSEISLKDCLGKKLILNIFPSLDTPTCSRSMRRFNEIADQLNNSMILCVSADLPFAQIRFCGAENLKNVIPTSVFRHSEFGKKYGLTIANGPIAGLLSRAIVVIDEKGKVVYTEQVAEIADEPDYESVLKVIQG